MKTPFFHLSTPIYFVFTFLQEQKPKKQTNKNKIKTDLCPFNGYVGSSGPLLDFLTVINGFDPLSMYLQIIR